MISRKTYFFILLKMEEKRITEYDYGNIFGISFGISLIILSIFVVIFQHYDKFLSIYTILLSVAVGIFTLELIKRNHVKNFGQRLSFLDKIDDFLNNGLIFALVVSIVYIFLYGIRRVYNIIMHFSVIFTVIIFTVSYSYLFTLFALGE